MTIINQFIIKKRAVKKVSKRGKGVPVKERKPAEVKANQYQYDPRQTKFLEFYLDLKSKTFGNARASALRVGYSEEYADNIMHLLPDWLSENIGESKLLLKALRNLDELLDEKKDKKVKAFITKFVAERLGKNKFAQKTEVNVKGTMTWAQVIQEINGQNK